MRRILILGIALLVALVPLSAARAADVDARALESFMGNLEGLIGEIEGVDFAALKVRSHGNGLYSVAVPLPEATGSACWRHRATWPAISSLLPPVCS